MKLNKAGLKYILSILDDFDTHCWEIVKSCMGKSYFNEMNDVNWYKDDTVGVGWEYHNFGDKENGRVCIPLNDFLSTDYVATGKAYREKEEARKKEKETQKLKEQEKEKKLLSEKYEREERELYKRLKVKYE